MGNKERIDYLLLDIRELEKQVAGVRNVDRYPVSFFSQTFELAHKVLTELHSLEADQLEELSRQMEEHRQRIHAVSYPKAVPVPEIEKPHEEKKTNMERTETVIVHHKVTEPEVEQEHESGFVAVDEEMPPIPEAAAPVEETKIPVPPIEDKKKGTSLNDVIEKKILSDFRKAFSLNDRFRFRRELFGGDEQRMNKAIADLNDIHSYEESITYLHEKLHWNIEDEAVAGFIELLEKRFM